MKHPLRKAAAFCAVLFTVAGLLTVTSINPVAASSDDCATPDLYVNEGQVHTDNGSATWRIEGRTVHIERVAPWSIQSARIVLWTSRNIQRNQRIYEPGDVHYQLKPDEIRVMEIYAGTDIPMCGDQPSEASASCGYYMVAADGGMFTYGKAQFFGSMGATPLNQPVFSAAVTKSGSGYWLVARDGGIFSFGDAKFHGSTGAMVLNQPIAGIARTPSGNGYWLVARDGGIFSFGDAKFHGSTGAMKLTAPVVAMVATGTGNGYWLVGQDAKVYAFGDARHWGQGGTPPMVDAKATGDGYRMVNSSGDAFAFTSAGGAAQSGSGTFSTPVVAVGNDPSTADTTSGYWLASANGEVLPVGTESYCGSASNLPLNQPIVGFIPVG